MNELRDWARNVGYSLCMVITTRSSVAERKIVLHCEKSGKYRAGKKKVFVEEEEEEDSSNPINSRTRKTGCPFELHGIYNKGNSYTNAVWKLSVVRGYHNHPLATNLIGHSFASRLTKEQRKTVMVDTACGMKPKAIFAKLLRDYPGTFMCRNQVYSAKAFERLKSMGNLNVTQYSLDFLKSKGYFTDTASRKGPDGKSVVTDLFISHPDARHLLRLFPNVVIMDSTYKTNRYIY